MSLLNIALQSIGLMREAGDAQFEQLMHSCNSMKQIRSKAEQNPGMKEKLLQSVKAPTEMIQKAVQALKLKDNPFETPEAVDASEIEEVFNMI